MEDEGRDLLAQLGVTARNADQVEKQVIEEVRTQRVAQFVLCTIWRCEEGVANYFSPKLAKA